MTAQNAPQLDRSAGNPGNPRRRAPGEKRAALLQAAQALFSSQGYDNTSTAQIASHAAVSEGILFHHFGSKQGLLDAVASAFVEAGIAATTQGQLRDMSEEGVVRSAFDFADRDPGLYQLLDHLSGTAASHGLAGHSEAIVAAIAARLREAMAAGLARKSDATIMARLQFTIVDGAYRSWRRHGSPQDRETYIQEAAWALRAMAAPNHTHTHTRNRDPGGPNHE